MNQTQKRILIIVLSILGMLLIVGAVIWTIIIIQNDRAEGPYTEQQAIFQEEADDEYEAMFQEYIDMYPIAMNLPVIEENWRIDYGLCETSDGEFCVMITGSTEEYQKEALEALTQLEFYEENKYTIEYFDE